MDHYQQSNQNSEPSGNNGISDISMTSDPYSSPTSSQRNSAYYSAPYGAHYSAQGDDQEGKGQFKQDEDFGDNQHTYTSQFLATVMRSDIDSKIPTSSGRNHVVPELSNLSTAGQSNLSQIPSTPASDSQAMHSSAYVSVPKTITSRVGGFPAFADGDVLVVSPTGKRWRLHSLILSQSSTTLKDIFMSTQPVEITAKMRKEGKTIKWKLEMIRENQADSCDPGSLKFKKFISVGVNTRPIMWQNFNGLGQTVLFNEVYDNFFRCIYNITPNYGKENIKDENKNSYIGKITDLLQAATYLDAVSAIRVNVEAHLLRMASVLWLHIQSKPEGWVHIAGLLQSDIIFRECMVHLVGRFHLKNGIDKQFLEDKSHGELGLVIWELIKKKANQLKDLKLYVERHLIEWFPPRMIHTDDNPIIPGRAVYTNDIYFWIALSLVRQYIMSAFMMNYHHRASDGGMAFYRSIAAADATYINAATLERFHVVFDMSAKARQVLIEAIQDFKKDIRPLVEDLLIDRSQGRVDGKEFPHFTCTIIEEDEMPWNILIQRNEAAAANQQDVDMGY